jgi:thiamine-phosphate pyrophosphorylase
MLRYAITSRILLADAEAERAERLIALASRWGTEGVDYIQLRERDIPDADLLKLASKIVQAVRRPSSPAQISTQVLINSATEKALSIALDSGADGVHLPGGLSAQRLAATIDQLHKGWQSATGRGVTPVISVSCHSAAEVRAARAAGASIALFAPVFEKALPGEPALPGRGIESLRDACLAAHEPAPHPEIDVVALGGITLENTAQCIAAGADGIAAIRLFLNAETKPRWESMPQAY